MLAVVTSDELLESCLILECLESRRRIHRADDLRGDYQVVPRHLCSEEVPTKFMYMKSDTSRRSSPVTNRSRRQHGEQFRGRRPNRCDHRRDLVRQRITRHRGRPSTESHRPMTEWWLRLRALGGAAGISTRQFAPEEVARDRDDR